MDVWFDREADEVFDAANLAQASLPDNTATRGLLWSKFSR